jgi:hypothetical protein
VERKSPISGRRSARHGKIILRMRHVRVSRSQIIPRDAIIWATECIQKIEKVCGERRIPPKNGFSAKTIVSGNEQKYLFFWNSYFVHCTFLSFLLPTKIMFCFFIVVVKNFVKQKLHVPEEKLSVIGYRRE